MFCPPVIVVAPPLEPPVMAAAAAAPASAPAASLVAPSLGDVYSQRLLVDDGPVVSEGVFQGGSVFKLDIAEPLELVRLSVSNQTNTTDLQILEDSVQVALNNVVRKVAYVSGKRWLVWDGSLGPTSVAAAAASASSSVTVPVVISSSHSVSRNCVDNGRLSWSSFGWFKRVLAAECRQVVGFTNTICNGVFKKIKLRKRFKTA